MKSSSHLTTICAIILSAVLLSTVHGFGVGTRGLQARPAQNELVTAKHYVSSSDNTSCELPCVLDQAYSNSHAVLIKKPLREKIIKPALATLLLSTIVLISTQQPALAAKAATTAVEHLHTGQKIANYFRSFGLPDLAILAIISALPVVELRGAVPVGVWMGYPVLTVLPVCVLGNMCPIVPLMFLLRNEGLKKLMSPILSRAEKKSASLGVGSIEKQWASLAAFVGIPLPGTGAWTGAMGAFLLGMPTSIALSAIFTGVVGAGCIMSAITLAGKKGGIVALVVLGLITGQEFFGNNKNENSEGAGI